MGTDSATGRITVCYTGPEYAAHCHFISESFFLKATDFLKSLTYRTYKYHKYLLLLNIVTDIVCQRKRFFDVFGQRYVIRYFPFSYGDGMFTKDVNSDVPWQLVDKQHSRYYGNTSLYTPHYLPGKKLD